MDKDIKLLKPSLIIHLLSSIPILLIFFKLHIPAVGWNYVLNLWYIYILGFFAGHAYLFLMWSPLWVINEEEL